MKKETLVAQLEAAKALSSTVDIDKVISLINQIESEVKSGLTQELAEEIADKIERCLDRNCDDLVDKETVTFEIQYGNELVVDEAQINVSETMSHITAVLDTFIVDEDEEEDLYVAAYNENFGPDQDEDVEEIPNESGLVQAAMREYSNLGR